MKKQVKAKPVAITGTNLFDTIRAKQAEMEANPPNPLSPENAAKVADAIKKLQAMGGFAVFTVPTKTKE